MHTFTRVISLLSLLVLVPMTVAFAQTEVTPPTGDEPTVEGVLLANINLGDVTIIEKTDTAITLGFVLSNAGDTPQSDIRYGVDLLLAGEDGEQTVFDTYVAPEVVSLSPGEVVTKKVTYSTVGIYSDEYELWVTAQTAGGVMLGLGSVGKVELGTKEAVVLDSDSCLLTVGGEDNLEYDLYQGVDVAASEDLFLTCTVQNGTEKELVLEPSFKSYVRTIYGDPVTETFPPGMSFPVEVITVAAGDSKEITVTIPKPLTPQAYDTVLSMVDSTTKRVVSNRVAAHYVIQGVSATIQTVNFTKTEYVSGEEIVLSLFWTGSADGFDESRQGAGTPIEGEVKAEITVNSADGIVCAPAFITGVKEGVVTLTTNAVADCVSPVATVKLVGPDGVVLDSSTIATPVAPQKVAEEESTATTVPVGNDFSRTLMYVVMAGLGLALLSILAAIARQRYLAKQTFNEEV